MKSASFIEGEFWIKARDSEWRLLHEAGPFVGLIPWEAVQRSGFTDPAIHRWTVWNDHGLLASIWDAHGNTVVG